MINIKFSDIPPVVKNLIIINIIMLLATWVLGNAFGIQLSQVLGLHYFKSDLFQPYQFVTHIFMHGDFTHLLFNMFAFWMFGRVLEQVWGSKRFFIYFIVTALGAAVLHTFVQWIELAPMKEAANVFLTNPNLKGFELFVSEHLSNPHADIFNFINTWGDDPNNPV